MRLWKGEKISARKFSRSPSYKCRGIQSLIYKLYLCQLPTTMMGSNIFVTILFCEVQHNNLKLLVVLQIHRGIEYILILRLIWNIFVCILNVFISVFSLLYTKREILIYNSQPISVCRILTSSSCYSKSVLLRRHKKLHAHLN